MESAEDVQLKRRVADYLEKVDLAMQAKGVSPRDIEQEKDAKAESVG